MSRSERDTSDTRAEARARNGFILINVVRFGGVGLVMLGFAIVRGVVGLPYAAGAVLAVAGFFAVFFLPRVIARRWNAGDWTRK